MANTIYQVKGKGSRPLFLPLRRTMPRANRHFLPGYVWHITRCHRRNFLLKFRRDRRSYLVWVLEAKKRFGLSVLNYGSDRDSGATVKSELGYKAAHREVIEQGETYVLREEGEAYSSNFAREKEVLSYENARF